MIYALAFLAACGCTFVGLLVGLWLGNRAAYKWRFVEGYHDAVARTNKRVEVARQKAWDEGYLVGIYDRKESLR